MNEALTKRQEAAAKRLKGLHDLGQCPSDADCPHCTADWAEYTKEWEAKRRQSTAS